MLPYFLHGEKCPKVIEKERRIRGKLEVVKWRCNNFITNVYSEYCNEHCGTPLCCHKYYTSAYCKHNIRCVNNASITSFSKKNVFNIYVCEKHGGRDCYESDCGCDSIFIRMCRDCKENLVCKSCSVGQSDKCNTCYNKYVIDLLLDVTELSVNSLNIIKMIL